MPAIVFEGHGSTIEGFYKACDFEIPGRHSSGDIENGISLDGVIDITSLVVMEFTLASSGVIVIFI